MSVLGFLINPYLTNEFSHHYQSDESTFILGVLGVIFTPHSAASHLGLFCLPISHKRDARLKRVKFNSVPIFENHYTTGILKILFVTFILQFCDHLKSRCTSWPVLLCISELLCIRALHVYIDYELVMRSLEISTEISRKFRHREICYKGGASRRFT